MTGAKRRPAADALRVSPLPGSAFPGDAPVLVEPAALAPRPGPGDAPAGAPAAGDHAVVGAIVPGSDGSAIVEVVSRGWRFVFRVEAERRAALRDRATGPSGGDAGDARLELRAIIPGRVASIAVVAGDQVDAGQELLVIEAMKMQNELRSPRDAVVERVAVAAGQTIELGDVQVVLGTGAAPAGSPGP